MLLKRKHLSLISENGIYFEKTYCFTRKIGQLDYKEKERSKCEL